MDPETGQKLTQDDTKRVPKMRFVRVLIFAFDLVQFGDPIWVDFAKDQHIVNKLSCSNMPPKDRSKKLQKGPRLPEKTHKIPPRGPQDASKRFS